MAQKRPPSWEMGEAHTKPLKPDMDAPSLASFSALSSSPTPTPGAQAGADRRKCSVTWELRPFQGQEALTPAQRRRGGVALQIF